MKIHFFERQFNEKQISIEKLFDIIQGELIKKGVDVKIFKNPFPLRKMFSAMLYFRKNQGDINHITGDIHWAVLLLDPKKTVLTIHDAVGMHQLTGLKKKIYFELWLKQPIKRLRYITVISEKTKQEIVEYLPWAKDKITVIPNCLTTEIAPDIFEKNNEVPKVLIIGTRSNKNLERTIPALKVLKIKLTIVGELSENQLSLLQENQLDFRNFENISDSELTNLYDESDILLFPSLYEGFGLPILEAQARNCAVITSDISPLKEVVGDAAILVNPENISEICSAVQLLLEDKTLRGKLIGLGKLNAKEYLPDKIAQQYLKLYKKILDKK